MRRRFALPAAAAALSLCGYAAARPHVPAASFPGTGSSGGDTHTTPLSAAERAAVLARRAERREEEAARAARRRGRLRGANATQHDANNRGDRNRHAAARHVIAIVGITGAGKSSTANTMLKARPSAADEHAALTVAHSGGGNMGVAGKGSGGQGGFAARPHAETSQSGRRNRPFGTSDGLVSKTRSVGRLQGLQLPQGAVPTFNTPGLCNP